MKASILEKDSSQNSLVTQIALSKQMSHDQKNVFGCVKEDEETVYYVQEIPIRNSASARVFWDRGSNRVFRRENYAIENN